MAQIIYGFALSAGVVKDLGNLDPGDARERLSLLSNMWKRNGIMVTDKINHFAMLGSVCNANGYPPNTRKYIKDFLTIRNLPITNNDDWVDHSTPPPMTKITPPKGTWFVGREESQKWGFDGETETKILEESGEICCLDRLSLSQWESVNNSVLFPKKHPTIEVLHIFSPLCDVAKSLDIIDRYCGKEEVVNPTASGLLRFLTGLIECRKGQGFKMKEIRIFTSYDVSRSMKNPEKISSQDIVEAWKNVQFHFHNTSIERIILHLVTDERFGAISHDRFVVFGAEALSKSSISTFTIGPGFSIFEGKRLSKSTSIASIEATQVRNLIDELKSEKTYETHVINIDR